MRSLMPVLLGLALTGCSLVPPYERPPMPTPQAFPDATASTVALPGWRAYYRDPALQRLIAAALDHNRDLRAAYARVAEARALAAMARAERFPAIEGNVSASRSRTPADVTGMNRERTATRLDVNLGLTAFELDLWGRAAALDEAARAQYLASRETARAFRASLVGEVAATWYLLAELRQREALAAATLESRSRSLTLTRRRRDAGLASDLDVTAAESLAAQARADHADAARQRRQAENALQLLTGMTVDIPPPGSPPLPEPLAPGLPSEVLVSRPDVLAAEQQLVAAHANVGAARAAIFPRITLTAAFGTASAALSGLFSAGSEAWNAASALRGAILDFGRAEANTEGAEARRAAALANYERTLQQAFREVADALAAENALREQLGAQAALMEAQQARLSKVRAREAAGVAGHLEVLDAERSAFAAEQAHLATRRALAAARIALFKALGGGAD